MGRSDPAAGTGILLLPCCKWQRQNGIRQIDLAPELVFHRRYDEFLECDLDRREGDILPVNEIPAPLQPIALIQYGDLDQVSRPQPPLNAVLRG